jgi:hypothetical protein
MYMQEERMKRLSDFTLIIVFATLVVLISSDLAFSKELPIFPGAQGFGITTPGGRGGKVYRVTNLNASGPGSLKEGIDQSGPRTCVFEVSGTIELTKDLVIRNPYITIAGQTAPSPGITLKGAALMIFSTHDVVLQHLRIRVGDKSSGPSYENRDGLKIDSGGGPVYNVVVDHLSVSWSTDELVSLWWDGMHDLTISNCIFSEALYCSKHPKGCHGMGVILGTDRGAGPRNVLLYGNLFAHNYGRNPLCKDGTRSIIANNLIYNRGWEGTYFVGSDVTSTVTGNVYISGKNSDKNTPVLSKATGTIWAKDNMENGAVPSGQWGFAGGGSPPVWVTPLDVKPSSKVEDFVLSNAGARPADRDSVDRRIVKDVRNRTGQFINSQDEVGGWPVLAKNIRPLTLPDKPNNDDNGDGYTNLDEWLHSYARDVEGIGNSTNTGNSVPDNTDNVPPSAPSNLRIQ